MIRNNRYRRSVLRKVGYKAKHTTGVGDIINKILIQFVVSCIIVLLAFGIKMNYLNSSKYLKEVKYVLEYNVDFKQYSNIVHKKVTEVLKTYDEGKFR